MTKMMGFFGRRKQWTKGSKFIISILLSTVLVALLSLNVKACEQKFEGFGVFLGSNKYFGRSKAGTDAKVLQVVYEFLGIRLFRTSYEPQFSPEENKYEINCTDAFTCSWINVHRLVSTLPGVKVFASVWSPPHYMKNDFYQLLPEYETAYLYFIKNITAIIKRDFNIEIERVSPVNEPENVFAPWDHTNMDPDQLCRIVKSYKDPLISICPENSYFWVSKIYYNFESDDPSLNCSLYCDIKATHAYSLNMDFTSSNSMLAYYDLKRYDERGTQGPIWMTEVSSTYRDPDETEMQEALDLATNIVNFVGVTCVQRYYFWYAFSDRSSGESLIWLNTDGSLYFPKKFYVYKLFVRASNTTHTPTEVNDCGSLSFRGSQSSQSANIVVTLECIQFGDVDRVLVNRELTDKQLDHHECTMLCCVTANYDYNCTESQHRIHSVPPKSVCHCVLSTPVILNNSIIL
ncbi:unnamed protein product [Orchesella dallaii]|uniref:Glucosylceramidase n=1 Tax=Orchesella dallaii TaxID=48710 RepID=A0ABP1PTS4_9HEXA